MNTFHKQERLCGKTHVETLFREGKKLVVWPLRVVYMQGEANEKTAVLIWAPKALFKHATDRNRLRRRMREAYRLNKQEVEDKGLRVAFRYMDKVQQPYAVIEKAMKKAIRLIVDS